MKSASILRKGTAKFIIGFCSWRKLTIWIFPLFQSDVEICFKAMLRFDEIKTGLFSWLYKYLCNQRTSRQCRTLKSYAEALFKPTRQNMVSQWQFSRQHLQLLLPWSWPYLKVCSLGPYLQIITVPVQVFQATFVLVTFVYISNISAVTEHI